MYPVDQDKREKYSVTTSTEMCEANEDYFGMPVRDQDQPSVPNFTWNQCNPL